MLSACRLLRPRLLAATTRGNASLTKMSATYDSFVAASVKAYEADKNTVNAAFDKELSDNKVVLFMEGTPDCPKSTQSMNVIKMLTQAQVVPLVSVDVMAHPALLGYTVSKSRSNRAPHLYVNGSYYGDHDLLLSKYSSGELEQTLGTQATKSTGAYAGELPIASY